jgi:Fe-S cluster biosynthesis and repair protein YggX
MLIPTIPGASKRRAWQERPSIPDKIADQFVARAGHSARGRLQRQHGVSVMTRMVKCVKLGREAEGLDFAPYPGELGKKIFENVSKEAWKQWLEQQKMLVNENRLNLADKKARDYLVQQMEKHFFGGGADTAQGYTPPASR